MRQYVAQKEGDRLVIYRFQLARCYHALWVCRLIPQGHLVVRVARRAAIRVHFFVHLRRIVVLFTKSRRHEATKMNPKMSRSGAAAVA